MSSDPTLSPRGKECETETKHASVVLVLVLVHWEMFTSLEKVLAYK